MRRSNTASLPAPRGRVVAARVAAAQAIGARLAKAIPTPRCELDFADPFQLLVATILSAQTTDKGVNRVTPELFRLYPSPAALAAAAPSDVEALVRSTGYYRTKARHIREAARLLVERHGGEVPRDLDALVRLPGVARKTANVVLGVAFGIPSGIPVDTHVFRVSRRLGLSRGRTPAAVEQDLMRLFARSEWTTVGPRLVLHGRYTCVARAPRCADCPLRDVCPAPEARP